MYILGVTPDQISLNIIGYAVQHEIFSQMSAGTSNFLGELALVCGLIGFVTLLIAPRSMSIFSILGWLFLVVIIFARPVAETLFYTNLSASTIPQLQSNVPVGGSGGMNQQDYDKYCNSNSNIGDLCSHETYADYFNASRTNLPVTANSATFADGQSTMYGFTPELAIVNVLSQINYGLQNSLMDVGQRTYARDYPTMEALSRSTTNDGPTTYNTAEFLHACGGKVTDINEAYIPTQQLQLKDPQTYDRLMGASFTAQDAVSLYGFYMDYMSKNGNPQQLYPVMVCDANSATVTKSGGAYSYSTSRTCGDDYGDDAVKTVLSYIQANPKNIQQITDAVNSPNTVWNDITKAMNQLPGDTPEQKWDALSKVPVVLAVPFNFEQIDAGANATVTGATSATSQNWLTKIMNGLTGVAVGNAQSTSITGSVLAWVAGLAGALTPVGSVTTAANGSNPFSVANASAKDAYSFLTNTLTLPTINAASVARKLTGTSNLQNHDPLAALVPNCGYYHLVSDARMAESYVNHMALTDVLTTLRKNNGTGEQLPDFSKLSQDDKTSLALAMGIIAAGASCDDNNADCKARLQEKYNHLITAGFQSATSNSLAAAQAAHDATGDPRFIHSTRDAMSWLGKQTSGILMWFKAMGGGFEAGTYSIIMPLILGFIMSIMIMFTPLLYMIGLMIPAWSISIISIPLLTIAFCGLVEIEMTIINAMAGIFLESSNQGFLSSHAESFSDVLLGTAYTSGFLITGAVLFSLKSPTGALQKIAGQADQAATVTFKDALEAGAAVVGVAKIASAVVTGPAGLAAGAASLATSAGKMMGGMQMLGSMVGGGGGEGEGGVSLPSFLKDHMEKGRASVIGEATQLHAQSEWTSGKDVSDFQRIANGRYIDDGEAENKRYAKSSGMSDLYKPEKGTKEVGGKKLEVAADSKMQALESALRKGGVQGAQQVISQLLKAIQGVRQTNPDYKFAELNAEKQKNEGKVEYTFDMKMIKQVNGAAADALSKYSASKGGNHTDKDGNFIFQG